MANDTVRTIQQLAQLAIDVQNACNLSGVAHSFSKVVSELWEHAHEQKKGTDWVNKHPIVQAFADKLASLSHIQGFNSNAIEAHRLCEQLAQGVSLQDN